MNNHIKAELLAPAGNAEGTNSAPERMRKILQPKSLYDAFDMRICWDGKFISL